MLHEQGNINKQVESYDYFYEHLWTNYLVKNKTNKVCRLKSAAQYKMHEWPVTQPTRAIN